MQILQSGKQYNFVNHVKINSKLENLNYEYAETDFGPSLIEIDEILLPKKIYSNDKEFIDHVGKSWTLSKGNLGICLVGEKGLGKSLTANIIAKNANAPVIRITRGLGNNAIFKFLNEIEQDFVLVIDEFEKMFNSTTNFDKNENNGINQEAFLSFLDGGSVRKNRIMFIITSNNEFKISEFLKNRPSRLKYFKKYEKMEDSVIKEIVSDLLEDQKFADDLIKNIPYIGLNTDVLIQVIKEINTHKVPYTKFKDFFNFRETEERKFTLFSKGKNGEKDTELMKLYPYDDYYEEQALRNIGGFQYKVKKEFELSGNDEFLDNIEISMINVSTKEEKTIDCYIRKEEGMRMHRSMII